MHGPGVYKSVVYGLIVYRLLTSSRIFHSIDLLSLVRMFRFDVPDTVSSDAHADLQSKRLLAPKQGSLEVR